MGAKVNYTLKNNKYYSEIIERGFIDEIKRLYVAKSRFITATAFENSDGSKYIFYHFEKAKAILTLKVKVQDNTINSISKYYPTAAWIEQEMTELYGIELKSANSSSKNKKRPLLINTKD